MELFNERLRIISNLRLNLEFKTFSPITDPDALNSRTLNLEINNLKFEVNRRLLKILNT